MSSVHSIASLDLIKRKPSLHLSNEKKRQVTRKSSKEKYYHNKRIIPGRHKMNETKRSKHIQRMMNKEAYKKLETPSQSNLVCFKCGKVGHYKKDCKIRKKINNLNILEDLKDMFYEVLLSSSKYESRIGSENEDDINQLDTDEETSSQTSSDQDDCIKGNFD